MAITAATKLSDFSGFLTREQSQPIFERAAQASVIQRLVQEVPLGGSGVSIPVVTGKLTAGWVAEGAQKPASAGALGLKTMDPKKIAAIAVVSAEVVRANPGNYMTILRNQVGEAFATAFDAAAMHGTSSPFSTNLDTGSGTQELTGTAPATTAVYDDLNAVLATLVNSGKRLTGWALDSRIEPILNGQKDTAGRPIFLDAPPVDTTDVLIQGRLLSRRAFIGDGVYKSAGAILGYGGDFTQAAWGVVGGISYSVSTEATVTINGALTSLWENNLVAILAEAEYGWLVNDAAAFVKITNAT